MLRYSPGVEYLYKHNAEQLFLSVYVDDKMAGEKAAVACILSEVLDLDEPVPLDKNVCLGCGQQNVVIPDTYLSDKQDSYKSLLADDVHTTNGLSTPANTNPAKRGVKQGSNASNAGGDLTQFKAAKDVNHINTI